MATQGRGPHCPSNLEHSVESRDRLDTRVVVVLATREKGAAGETKGIQGWLDEGRKAGREGGVDRRGSGSGCTFNFCGGGGHDAVK